MAERAHIQLVWQRKDWAVTALESAIAWRENAQIVEGVSIYMWYEIKGDTQKIQVLGSVARVYGWHGECDTKVDWLCDLLVLQNPKFHESLNGTAKVFLIQGSSPLPEDIAKVFWKAFHWLM